MKVLVRLLARVQATRGRVVFAAVIGVLVAVGGGATALADAPRTAVVGLLTGAGLRFLVPVVSLVFASAVLGDLREDGTLVYVWLRPRPRLQLAASAVASSVLVAMPLTVLPLGAAALLAGRPGMIFGIVVAATLGVAAYVAVFVPLGLVTTRSLVWGLLYVLLWEGAISNVHRALASLSLQRYVVSVFAETASGVGARQYGVDLVPALVVLVAVTAGAVWLGGWALRRVDVP